MFRIFDKSISLNLTLVAGDVINKYHFADIVSYYALWSFLSRNSPVIFEGNSLIAWVLTQY